MAGRRARAVGRTDCETVAGRERGRKSGVENVQN